MTEYEITHGLSQDAPGPLEPVEVAKVPESLGTGSKPIARWYAVDKHGAATLCICEEDARETAAESAKLFPNCAPYTAVRLVPVSAPTSHPIPTGATGEDDIVQRLRDNADLDAAEDGNPAVIRLEREAANEIERLRRELADAPAAGDALDEPNDLIERLLDAQQDLNQIANETMSQTLCSVSALLDEIEVALRRQGSRPSSASSGAQAVPAEVKAALDRMCTPLDQSWLKGVTAEADAKCMQTIRDYILHRPACAPAAGDALEWTLISDRLPEIPDGAPGKRIHILVGRHYGGRWFSWSLWYGPRGQDLRFYEEFADEDADGDDVELTQDDDCATHWRYMPAGPAIAQQKGEA